MTETAIQIRPDGTAEIYRGGRQYLRVSGDDGKPRWLKRTSRGLRPVSDHRARRLERAYLHRDDLPKFLRFPRLKSEPKVVAKMEQIRGLWEENQKVQAVNKQNRYELGKALNELHALRAHHGNGTYDRDVEALGIPKPTAWRIRNYYREVAGLSPVSEFVSFETNPPDGTSASPATSPSGESGRRAAEILRERAAKQKKITQVRLDPERHKIFHKKLKKLAVAFGTEGVSETTFKTIATYEVPACAK
jgi:hypothetical protein